MWLLMAAAVVAAVPPATPDRAVENCRKEIVVYFDLSQTMLEDSRLDRVLLAVAAFLKPKIGKRDRIHYVSFASTLASVVSIEPEAEAIDEGLARLPRDVDANKTRIDLVLDDIRDRLRQTSSSQLFIVASDFAHDPLGGDDQPSEPRITDFTSAVERFPDELRSRFTTPPKHVRLALIRVPAEKPNDVATSESVLAKLKTAFDTGEALNADDTALAQRLLNVVSVSLTAKPKGSYAVGPHDQKLELEIDNPEPWPVLIKTLTLKASSLEVTKSDVNLTIPSCESQTFVIESDEFDRWMSTQADVKFTGDGVADHEIPLRFEGVFLQEAAEHTIPAATFDSVLTHLKFVAANDGTLTFRLQETEGKPLRYKVKSHTGVNDVYLQRSLPRKKAPIDTEAKTDTAVTVENENKVFTPKSDAPVPDGRADLPTEQKPPGLASKVHEKALYIAIGMFAIELFLFKKQRRKLRSPVTILAEIGGCAGLIQMVNASIPYGIIEETTFFASGRIVALTLFSFVIIVRKLIIVYWPAIEGPLRNGSNAQALHGRWLTILTVTTVICIGGACLAYFSGGLPENGRIARPEAR